MKKLTVPMLAVATLLLTQPGRAQVATGTGGGVAGTGTGAGAIGLPPVVAPPVENLVPGSEGNIVFPPAENLVPGSQNQIVFPPVENLIPGGGGAAALTPGTTNNLGNLGLGTTGTGSATGTRVTPGGVFNFSTGPGTGLGTGGTGTGAAVPGVGTSGVPGQLLGGQGGFRGDGFTSGNLGGQPNLGVQPNVGGGTGGGGANTLAPGSRPGSPEAITAPTEPFDADEPDTLDFSASS